MIVSHGSLSSQSSKAAEEDSGGMQMGINTSSLWWLNTVCICRHKGASNASIVVPSDWLRDRAGGQQTFLLGRGNDPRINYSRKTGQEGWKPTSSRLLSQRDQWLPLPGDSEQRQQKDGSTLSLDKKELLLLFLFTITVYCHWPWQNGGEGTFLPVDIHSFPMHSAYTTPVLC